MSCLFFYFTCALLPHSSWIQGIWQLSCFFQDGFAVLRGNIVSILSTVRSVAHQQHFQLFNVVDQKLLEAIGQHMLRFLVAAIISVGHHDLELGSSPYPVINASGFLPVTLNFDIFKCDCYQINFLIFLMIVSFMRNLRAVMMLGWRWRSSFLNLL